LTLVKMMRAHKELNMKREERAKDAEEKVLAPLPVASFATQVEHIPPPSTTDEPAVSGYLPPAQEGQNE